MHANKTPCVKMGLTLQRYKSKWNALEVAMTPEFG
jgi:hypothetical protein